ncbi:MAG: AMP-binding protein, partial [Thaumarchaeota archaeon]|nr:AMP-binding protein [Nitrososphaerota archaeon]MDE1877814.1 AMP-binding protein [Nitrososphaerota archaeon]
MSRYQPLQSNGDARNNSENIDDGKVAIISQKKCINVSMECNPKTEIHTEKYLHELFESQVRSRPDAPALIQKNYKISYRDLNTRANQLAHYLRNLGVKPDTLVGVCVERSIEMIVAILATLKAGGAYVPLNPTYPKRRLQLMIQDCSPSVLIIHGNIKHMLRKKPEKLIIVDLMTNENHWMKKPETNPSPYIVGLDTSNLAYVMYTSGSSGMPKGVMVEHRSVCNQIISLRSLYKLSWKDRFLQFASMSFDMSVEEIFGALSSGATLVLRTDDWLTNEKQFWQLCESNNISVVNLPTKFWQQLVEQESKLPSCLRQVMIGGEAVTDNALQSWFKRTEHRPKLFNAYGPTETTVNATISEVTSDPSTW